MRRACCDTSEHSRRSRIHTRCDLLTILLPYRTDSIHLLTNNSHTDAGVRYYFDPVSDRPEGPSDTVIT